VTTHRCQTIARALLGAGLLLGAWLTLAACSARPVAPPPPEIDPLEKSEYVIGAGDVLLISVWRNPELTVEVPVRPDGKLSMPLVDDVHAEGLTTLELKQLLTRALSEYVANPDVTVVVRQVLSKRVHLVGGVVRSGPIVLQRDTRVLDALSQAGGFTTFADKGDIKIIRRVDNGDVEYHFDYNAFVGGRAPGTNLVLQPGDVVVVPD
jgi:polysaccharide export outer membrane protein